MTRPLRIVHVYNWLDPANGGPPRVIVGLAAGQQRLGHHVSLISSDRPASVEEFLAEHLDPIPARATVRPKFFWPVLTRSTLHTALRGADIAHLHGIWPPVTLLASRVCRALRIPYVLAPHGSLHTGALWEKWPRKQVGLWALGYAGLVRSAAALHVLNEDEARVPWFVPRPQRVEVVPNGVFPETFAEPPPAGAFRSTLPAIGDDPYVLFLARLHPGKGCDLLGEAFGRLARQHPRVRLVAIGPDQGGRAMIESAARTHGAGDRVHCIGPVFGPRKHAALAEAAVYCLPSHHEGFSVAILEAMAHGRPVVISDRCHFDEVAAVGAGRVVPLDASALTAALGAVLADPEAAEQMGDRGRTRVLDHYTWPEIAARTVELYRAVLAAHTSEGV